jgi:hypothetical protein
MDGHVFALHHPVQRTVFDKCKQLIAILSIEADKLKKK